jgi:hypothetical protein
MGAKPASFPPKRHPKATMPSFVMNCPQLHSCPTPGVPREIERPTKHAHGAQSGTRQRIRLQRDQKDAIGSVGVAELEPSRSASEKSVQHAGSAQLNIALLAGRRWTSQILSGA